MKFCASLAFTDPEDYCELAVLAEECGWDALVLSDHVVHPRTITSKYPYAEDGLRPWEAEDPWPDVWVAIAAMGAVTTRTLRKKKSMSRKMSRPASGAEMPICLNISLPKVSWATGSPVM